MIVSKTEIIVKVAFWKQDDYMYKHIGLQEDAAVWIHLNTSLSVNTLVTSYFLMMMSQELKIQCPHSAGKTCKEFLKKGRAEMVPDEDVWVVCLCCHLPVSFLLPPLLLASAELLVETQSDRAAHQGHYRLSCAQYLSPPVENKASSNTVHQAATLTLSGLIRLMAAIRCCHGSKRFTPSFHLSLCHYLVSG